MKNIMFLVDGNKEWIGGVYYVKNILYSLLLNPKTEENFKIYVYINHEVLKIFEMFIKYENVEFIEFNEKLDRVELVKICLLYDIKAVYPVIDKRILELGEVGIGWIPDFQHKHLPEMFSESDIEYRGDLYSFISKQKRELVLSSNDAKDAYEKLYPNAISKVVVIPFVSYIDDLVDKIDDHFVKSVLSKYEIEKEYIYLPNQFWKHKNHITVFKSINYLKSNTNNDLNIRLICTGNTSDYRNLEHFNELKKYIKENNLDRYIKILGLIPRDEQLAIMKGAKLLIQPSLYEGWGTSLEEAKFFDKRVLLSDIAVHYEQKNDRCILFERNSYIDLANKIISYYNEIDSENYERGRRYTEKCAEIYSEIVYTMFEEKSNSNINNKLITQYENKLKELFDNINKENIAIYGTGEHTIHLIRAYELFYDKKIENVVYLDSNISKRGEKFLDGTIYHKNDISKLNINKIIISSYAYQDQIYESIKEYENEGIKILKMYDQEEEILFI
ncbi:glycosyltransferase [Clostridium saccharoperbutylacetonicum]|uniref:glycosyltransferase n=1 Tax=Clostridium saccharoperbutylacetonicum TaxID=36745 RepID=UPI0039ECC5AA